MNTLLRTTLLASILATASFATVQITDGAGAEINTYESGIGVNLTIDDDGSLTIKGNSNLVENKTITLKSGSTTTIASGVTFTNNGTIDLQAGSSATIANTSTIQNNGGTINMVWANTPAQAGVLTGAGAIDQVWNASAVNGAINIYNLGANFVYAKSDVAVLKDDGTASSDVNVKAALDGILGTDFTTTKARVIGVELAAGAHPNIFTQLATVQYENGGQKIFSDLSGISDVTTLKNHFSNFGVKLYKDGSTLIAEDSFEYKDGDGSLASILSGAGADEAIRLDAQVISSTPITFDNHYAINAAIYTTDGNTGLVFGEESNTHTLILKGNANYLLSPVMNVKVKLEGENSMPNNPKFNGDLTIGDGSNSVDVALSGADNIATVIGSLTVNENATLTVGDGATLVFGAPTTTEAE